MQVVLKTHVPNLLISWAKFSRKVLLIDFRETFIRTKVQYPFVPFWRVKCLSIRFFSVFLGTKCSILVFFEWEGTKKLRASRTVRVTLLSIRGEFYQMQIVLWHKNVRNSIIQNQQDQFLWEISLSNCVRMRN